MDPAELMPFTLDHIGHVEKSGVRYESTLALANEWGRATIPVRAELDRRPAPRADPDEGRFEKVEDAIREIGIIGVAASVGRVCLGHSSAIKLL
jgi:hypothetical protein